MTATTRTPQQTLPRPHRSRSRRVAIGLVAAALGSFAVAASATAGPPATNQVPGDPHSPAVAHLATEALDSLYEFEATDNPIVQLGYFDALDAAAGATAAEIGVDTTAMRQAWRAADRVHQTALLSALTQLGVQYRSNTSEPGVGFDCSGLTTFAWAQAGFEIPRQSGSQISEAGARDASTAEAGDLVQYPGHVMLYLGVADAIVHSSNPENDVELWVLSGRRAGNVRYGDPTDDA